MFTLESTRGVIVIMSSPQSTLQSSLFTQTINGHPTTFACTIFADRILIIITQLKTFGSMFTVGETIADGLLSPANQLSAKCVLGHKDDSGLSETVCERISELLREKCSPRGVVLPPLFVTLAVRKDAGMEELRLIVTEAVERVAETMRLNDDEVK